LGERRLGELFFGRQTIGRQQSFQNSRFVERRLGDKGMQFAFLLASINSTSSAMTHWIIIIIIMKAKIIVTLYINKKAVL